MQTNHRNYCAFVVNCGLTLNTSQIYALCENEVKVSMRRQTRTSDAFLSRMCLYDARRLIFDLGQFSVFSVHIRCWPKLGRVRALCLCIHQTIAGAINLKFIRCMYIFYWAENSHYFDYNEWIVANKFIIV